MLANTMQEPPPLSFMQYGANRFVSLSKYWSTFPWKFKVIEVNGFACAHRMNVCPFVDLMSIKLIGRDVKILFTNFGCYDYTSLILFFIVHKVQTVKVLNSGK